MGSFVLDIVKIKDFVKLSRKLLENTNRKFKEFF